LKKFSIFLFVLLLLAGCSQKVYRNTDLEGSIQSMVKDESKSEINLVSLTKFDWDKAFLITPYSTPEGIKKQLGVDFKDPSNIDFRDDIYLLVFLNGDKVVQYAEVKRSQSDFSIGDKEFLTPASDSINIRRDK
jgi:uncharacterized protein YxeA